jgi:hypothetical protein
MEDNMILEKRIAVLPHNIQAAGLFLLVLTFSFFILQSPGYARTVTTPPTIIAGVVQEVSASSIRVNGNDYDISRAVLVTADGQRTFISLIKPGNRVAIVVEEGEVIKVRIDNRRIVK